VTARNRQSSVRSMSHLQARAVLIQLATASWLSILLVGAVNYVSKLARPETAGTTAVVTTIFSAVLLVIGACCGITALVVLRKWRSEGILSQGILVPALIGSSLSIGLLALMCLGFIQGIRSQAPPTFDQADRLPLRRIGGRLCSDRLSFSVLDPGERFAPQATPSDRKTGKPDFTSWTFVDARGRQAFIITAFRESSLSAKVFDQYVAGLNEALRAQAIAPFAHSRASIGRREVYTTAFQCGNGDVAADISCSGLRGGQIFLCLRTLAGDHAALKEVRESIMFGRCSRP
jgi:hypothetical protein